MSNNIPLTELILVVKILKDISYHCNSCSDCNSCIFKDVVCPNLDRRNSESPYLPEEWDYDLLIDRISNIEAKVGD